MSHLELPVSGMTCASCAARVERTLNGLDGVTRHGQLRDRAGHGRLRRRGRRARAARRRRRVRRLRRDPAGRPGARRRRGARAAHAAAGLRRPRRPGPRPLHDRPAAVRGLGGRRARPRHAGRALGRVAVPPRGLARPAPPHRDDGHAHQHRDARRVAVVGRRRGCRRRAPLPRGRLGGHGLRARGPAAGVAGSRPGELGARGAPAHRRARRRGALAGRDRAPGPRRASCAPATASSSAPASAWPPTASSRTGPRRSTHRSSPGSRAPSRSTRGTTSQAVR